MAAQLVLITADAGDYLKRTCGHTTAQGNGPPTASTSSPPPVGDEWYCAQCGLHAGNQFDPELTAARRRVTLEGFVVIAEAAQELGITPDAVWKTIKRGQLQGRQVGRQWFIPRPELERFKVLPRRRGPKPQL